MISCIEKSRDATPFPPICFNKTIVVAIGILVLLGCLVAAGSLQPAIRNTTWILGGSILGISLFFFICLQVRRKPVFAQDISQRISKGETINQDRVRNHISQEETPLYQEKDNFFKPLTSTEFNSAMLIPGLPFDLLGSICSFMEPRSASKMACVSKDWNFYVNECYKLDEILTKEYQFSFPYSDVQIKKYAQLSNLTLVLEHRLFRRCALNDLYALYHVEMTAMINHWGAVRAILSDKYGLMCSFVVDFHHPISLKASYQQGLMVNMTGGNGICDSPFVLNCMWSGQKRVVILSENRMAVSIQVIKNILLWSHTSMVDDIRIKTLEESISKETKLGDKTQVDRLKKQWQNFTAEDCMKFTLQMIKNSGKKILKDGLYLNGSDPHQELSLSEIIESFQEKEFHLTYLN